MTQLPSLLLLFMSLSLTQCLWWVLCGSEGMIIGSAAAVIVFEYTRNERKKARDKVKQRIKAEAKAKVSEPLNAIDLFDLTLSGGASPSLPRGALRTWSTE